MARRLDATYWHDPGVSRTVRLVCLGMSAQDSRNAQT
jgi:hypothetical protein